MNRQTENTAFLNGSDIEVLGEKPIPPPYQAPPTQIHIYGLTPRLFWTLIVLCTSLIAIGLGVGLGAGLATSNNKAKACQASSVQTKTVTSFMTTGSVGVPTAVAPAVPAVTLVLGTVTTNPGATDHVVIAEPLPEVACTANNLQNMTFSGYQINGAYLEYLVTCGTNWGEVYNGDYVHDIQVLTNITSLSNCIEECSLYSVQLPDSQTPINSAGYANFCSGVLWRDDDSCWLKSNITKGATGYPDTAVLGAAVLVPPSNGSWGVSEFYCGTPYNGGYSCT